MEQFTLSSSEIVLKQNMSETIICNHAALINPEEKQLNENTQRGLLGHSAFSVCIRETHAATQSK